jgi:glycine/D-amino acid oxidase-like deaminating enzyme
MTNSIFLPDHKEQPFWWEAAPRPEELGAGQLPSKADVVIIGSGYTGLNAAIQTARGGRHTVVVDAEAAGWGCSSRNGGQVSPSLKLSYHELVEKFGSELGYEIAREGDSALKCIGQFVQEEGIDCDFQRVGRFHGAHAASTYEGLATRNLSDIPDDIKLEAYMVPKAETRSEVDTDYYHGGIVFPHHCTLHPAKYHLGLLKLATEAGAEIVSHCKVGGINPEKDGSFTVETAKGLIRAKDVIVATSGYTGRTTPSLMPWHRRRIIPIGSYIIATEPLPEEQINRLMVNSRAMSDTRKMVVYYRRCHKGKRIVFGGRVAISESAATNAAPDLHREMCRIFPELVNTKISHSWMGFVGYTFNSLPHLGVRDGIHYSMGYCGSGVSLASYFGKRIGQRVLGLPEGKRPLEEIKFETRPFYNGKPWFLEPSIAYFRWKDGRA